ncbi:MAG TPA: peroxiredoxin [Pontiellaceae bacterium]|nr:peroxiredoxin [Pontiellaceae bacterium]HPR83602.1 peroxiredoxin [Pontiellaceae bacterium]
MSIKVGKPAPAFTLKGSDGEEHSLADYLGKTVVLYFYPKDDTPGCTKEACGFGELRTKFKKLNAVVLGVSKDSLTSHSNFIKKFKLPFVLLSNPDASVMKLYDAFGVKILYGKETTGTIRSTVIIGPDGTVAKHWKKVKKAEEHPAQVLEFLEAQAQ